MRIFVIAVVMSFLVCDGAADADEAAAAACSTLPQTLQMDSVAQVAVAVLLQRSPTFQRQCAIIASAPHVRITVSTVPPNAFGALVRARATIQRFSPGVLRVRIEIPAGGDVHELVAHEFEHVLEVLEGLDVERLSRVVGSGVSQVSGGFESDRAQAAGRAAAAEVRRATITAERDEPSRLRAENGGS